MYKLGTDGLDIYAWDAAANSSTGSGAWRHLPSMSVEEYSSATVVSTVEAIAPVTPLASPAYEVCVISGRVAHVSVPDGDMNCGLQTYLVYLPLRNAPSALSVGFLDENWCYDSASCKAKGIVDPVRRTLGSPKQPAIDPTPTRLCIAFGIRHQISELRLQLCGTVPVSNR